MTTILLDSHVVQWWASEPDRLSPAALRAINAADDLAVASVTWYELAWLAQRGRIAITTPVRPWLERLSANVQTVPTTPAIAATAAALPPSFPSDPADRTIYATALEQGGLLVTRDDRLLRHPSRRKVAIW